MTKSLAKTNEYNQKNLLRKIFQSDSPELYVKQLPAQALYLTIKQNGLADCLELIELCTVEQCQLFLDLDCWNVDSFNEDNFWRWLELPDCGGDTPNIDILEKILKASDLKIIACLLGRYVKFIVHEEPTDEPPAGDFFTPDIGFTWVNVRIPDPHRNFLLNRFLAMIFELDARIFYQLISVPNIATLSQLEEESFQDKQKRLESEGFPSWERALELNTPIKFDLKKPSDLSKIKSTTFNPDNLPEPTFKSVTLEPLGQLWKLRKDPTELDAELTMLINATMVRWRFPLDDFEKISFCAEQVTGAINIGLEVIVKNFHNDLLQIYEAYFLQKLYRIGLGEIYNLQKLAKKIDKDKLKALSRSNLTLFNEIAGLFEDFPQMAIGAIEIGQENITEYQAFRYLTDINQLSTKIADLVE